MYYVQYIVVDGLRGDQVSVGCTLSTDRESPSYVRPAIDCIALGCDLCEVTDCLLLCLSCRPPFAHPLQPAVTSSPKDASHATQQEAAKLTNCSVPRYLTTHTRAKY
jgi:hypothetical protein